MRTGGRTFSRELLRPAWDSCEELGWDEIEAKFKRIAGPIVGRVRSERLIEVVRTMDGSEDISFIGGASDLTGLRKGMYRLDYPAKGLVFEGEHVTQADLPLNPEPVAKVGRPERRQFF